MALDFGQEKFKVARGAISKKTYTMPDVCTIESSCCPKVHALAYRVENDATSFQIFIHYNIMKCDMDIHQDLLNSMLIDRVGHLTP